MFNGKTHYKWPFSIAMLNYQRVCIVDVVISADVHIMAMCDSLMILPLDASGKEKETTRRTRLLWPYIL
jgi:hypothetical protein